jgi:hypothetical protein
MGQKTNDNRYNFAENFIDWENEADEASYQLEESERMDQIIDTNR